MNYEEEIEYDLIDPILDRLTEYFLVNLKQDIIIHGQGSQTRSFYKQLRLDKDIELIWTAWCGPWWTLPLSFIPGQAGLVRLKNRKRLKEIFLLIGEMSFCSVYFLSRNNSERVITNITTKRKAAETAKEIVEKSKNDLIVEFDLDYHGGQRDGEIAFARIVTGTEISERFVNDLRTG